MASAVAALMIAAVACGNNNAKKAGEAVEDAVEAAADTVKACCQKAEAAAGDAVEAVVETVTEAVAE